MKTVQMNIDKFLGLHNDSLGDTELKIGELSDMKNFFITKNYNVQKRSGYLAQLTTATGHIIRGQWYGKIGATFHHIFASDGHIYKNVGNGTTTDLGMLTDAPTQFFYFGDAVYIQNGTEYKKWTGTGVISDVVGYVPLVMNSRNMGSASTGTSQEQINNLSSQRRMKFNGVSAQTIAYLIETNITSVDKVFVNGALQTVTTHYTVSLTNGTVTFGTAPSVGIDNVEIYYTSLAKTQLFDGTGSQVDFQLDETNISSVSSVYVNSAAVTEFSTISKNFTASNSAGLLQINCTNHGYSDDNVVIFYGADLPSPLVQGTAYYVLLTGSADNFKVKTSLLSTAVEYGDSGSGTLKVALSGVYLSNLTTGVITIYSAPTSGSKNVSIIYSSSTTQYPIISRQTHSRLYGGKNDTRVFIYGYDNTIYYSGLADGVPSAEYFPALNFIKVGNNNTKVMDLAKQYDRLIIFKEDSTGWASYEYTDVLGVEFPVYPLNDTVGCSVLGTTQLVENNPFTIHNNRLYQFVSTNVRDERNAQYISLRVQPLLDAETMTSAITFDNEKFGEFWIILGTEAYIYNYNLDVWYYYVFADTITSICNTDKLTIGTSVGQIMKFDGTLTDNTTAIDGYIKTGYLNYGTIMFVKFVNFIWLQLFLDGTASKADFYFQTDKDSETLVKSIVHTTETNPRAIRLKPKMKKFVVGKFIIKNNSTTQKCRILGISAPSNIGGIS
jgi:hypothetical protein